MARFTFLLRIVVARFTVEFAKRFETLRRRRVVASHLRRRETVDHRASMVTHFSDVELFVVVVVGVVVEHRGARGRRLEIRKNKHILVVIERTQIYVIHYKWIRLTVPVACKFRSLSGGHEL